MVETIPMSALEVLKSENYRLGNVELLIYDQARASIFRPPFMSFLYGKCIESGKTFLPRLFCGQRDLSHDAITTYLLQRPVMIPVHWTDETHYDAIGFAFPVLTDPHLSIKSPVRSGFCAYGMFKRWWGQPEEEVGTMLGIAYMFNEWNLAAIHGISYVENRLTRAYMRRFGFVQTGFVPRYQFQNGTLVPGVVTSLLKEDFERYVEHQLLG